MEIWLMENSFDGFIYIYITVISTTVLIIALFNLLYLIDKPKNFPKNKKRKRIIISIILFIGMIFFSVFSIKSCINYNKVYEKEIYQAYQETKLKTVYIKDIVALVSSEEDNNNLLNIKGLGWVEVIHDLSKEESQESMTYYIKAITDDGIKEFYYNTNEKDFENFAMTNQDKLKAIYYEDPKDLRFDSKGNIFLKELIIE